MTFKERLAQGFEVIESEKKRVTSIVVNERDMNALAEAFPAHGGQIWTAKVVLADSKQGQAVLYSDGKEPMAVNVRIY